MNHRHVSKIAPITRVSRLAPPKFTRSRARRDLRHQNCPDQARVEICATKFVVPPVRPRLIHDDPVPYPSIPRKHPGALFRGVLRALPVCAGLIRGDPGPFPSIPCKRPGQFFGAFRRARKTFFRTCEFRGKDRQLRRARMTFYGTCEFWIKD